MESTLRRTWAEIDLDAIAHNYRTLCHQMGPDARFLGVVKADAYGHGSVQVSRLLEQLGAGYLAVSNVDEARELRNAGIRLPILQLGITPVDQIGVLLENQVTQCIFSEPVAKAFSDSASALGWRLKVHIKLDTGMSRLGFQCDEEHFACSLEQICRIAALPGLEIEGIFTHFAVSDEYEASCREYTVVQHERFTSMIQALEQRGISIPLAHCANSGATASYPMYAHQMFRPGLLTYGVSEQPDRLGLRPAMTLKSVVGAIKHYEAGVTISYGRTFQTTRPTRAGVLPIGYADGFPRALSGKWSVWTSWGLAPVIGRICMDMCMVDLTDLPQVQEGDEVEIFGPHNSVVDAAHCASTISYELMCGVSKRVARHYIFEGKLVEKEYMLRDNR